VERDDEFPLNDDTVRHLENLAHSPSELRFRLAIVYALKDLRKEVRSSRVEILARVERAEKTIIGPGKVTHIVKSEMKEDQRVGKIETDVKRLWWFLGIRVIAMLGIIVGKVFK
jgi:hypothetical protein